MHLDLLSIPQSGGKNVKTLSSSDVIIVNCTNMSPSPVQVEYLKGITALLESSEAAQDERTATV